MVWILIHERRRSFLALRQSVVAAYTGARFLPFITLWHCVTAITSWWQWIELWMYIYHEVRCAVDHDWLLTGNPGDANCHKHCGFFTQTAFSFWHRANVTWLCGDTTTSLTQILYEYSWLASTEGSVRYVVPGCNVVPVHGLHNAAALPLSNSFDRLMTTPNNTLSRVLVSTAQSKLDAPFAYKLSELLTAETPVIIDQGLHWSTTFKKHRLQLCCVLPD